MRTREEITEEVSKLIEKNNDAYLGYKNAAENVSNTPLKSFLEQQSEKRNRYATELQSGLEILDPSAETNKSGSLKGDVHRAWMDLKAAFSSESEEKVLEECIRGEKASMEEYHAVLANAGELPSTVTETIKKQHDEIHETVNTVKRLEDLF